MGMEICSRRRGSSEQATPGYVLEQEEDSTTEQASPGYVLEQEEDSTKGCSHVLEEDSSSIRPRRRL